jgi:hypothetical protein
VKGARAFHSRKSSSAVVLIDYWRGFVELICSMLALSVSYRRDRSDRQMALLNFVQTSTACCAHAHMRVSGANFEPPSWHCRVYLVEGQLFVRGH